jgi:hypothetical protein
VKAATANSGPQYEVRRDIDVGPRTLKRGSHITMAELERLAPGKSGPLRRTGIVRLVGETDRERIQSKRDERKEYLHRAAQSDNARLAQFRSRQEVVDEP